MGVLMMTAVLVVVIPTNRQVCCRTTTGVSPKGESKYDAKDDDDSIIIDVPTDIGRGKNTIHDDAEGQRRKLLTLLDVW
eukprot:scaffold36188_cov78-Cyclotella_meneghiniana.AAC.2